MIFFTNLLCFVGWFFFALFCGIGISALPLDLILAYRDRPKFMDPKEFADRQKELQERVNALVDIGEIIKLEREQSDLNDVKSKSFFLPSFYSHEVREESKK